VPPTPASGPSPTYFWYETDTGDSYAYDGANWDKLNTATSVPDPIVPADGTQNITGALAVSGAISGSNLSGTNTGNQTTIVGITGTLAEYNTSLTGADFATGGGTVTGASSGTNTGDQTSIVGITGTIAQFNTACTDADFTTGGGTSSGTNTGDQTSIVGITGTKAQFDTACTDGNFLYVGDVTQYTDEQAQDAVGAMVDASLTYVDATPLLQRAALTGNVTAPAGSNATTIAAGVVTLAMQANMATASVVYRKTAGSGAPEVQTLATLKTDLGLTGTNSGDQTITLTTDVTGSGTGSFATTIAAGAVTLAKMANIATDRLIGRDTASTGVPEALTVGGGVEFTGSGGIQTSAFTGDVTKAAGGTATTIAADAVTFAKMQNAVANSKLVGSGASGAGADYVELTLGTNLSITGTTLNASGGGGTVPTGTGFTHITAGAQDAAAKLVDTADINNNQVTFTKFVAAPSAGVVWATGAADYSHLASGGGSTNYLRADGTWNAPPGGGGYTPPTGTGFPHITSGSQDAASKLVDTADINDAQVTLAKLANMATASLYYRRTASSGVPEVNTLAQLKTDLLLTGTNSGDQTSIVGISGTLAQFNTACSDDNFAGIGAANVFTANQQLSLATPTLTFNPVSGNSAIEMRGTASTNDGIRIATTAASAGRIQCDTFSIVNRAAGATYAVFSSTGLAVTGTLSATSTISASNLSGTNTGDQTITLTGNVTGSGTGSFATTIPAGTVTLAMQANMASDRLIGRDTASSGVQEELTVGGGIEFTGSGGIQTSAFTGDVTKTAGGTATTIASNAVTTAKILDDNVTLAKIANAAANSVLVGSGSAGTGTNYTEITLGTNLSMSGTVLNATGGGGSTPTGTGFTHITAGTQDAAAKLVDAADINDGQVTLAKMANLATDKLIGRDTAGNGVPESLTVGGGIEFTGGGGIQTSAFTGNVTKAAGSVATVIANGVVSGAMLTANGQVRCLQVVIDGGGSTITTGIKGDIEVPFACTITGWTMLLDQSGSIVVDIWKDTYANYPPVVGDSITASDKPTISATTKGQDLAPTGWTTAIAAGDTLRFNVDSITTATRAVLSIRVNVT